LFRKSKIRGAPSLRVVEDDNSETTWDWFKPIMTATRATTNPAIGPEAPISKIAFLVRMGDFIRMKAPNVPIKKGIGGAGMK
jgi:hypothetical protein